MPVIDEWERLCSEQDNAWREYVRASRLVRDKTKLPRSSLEIGLTLPELARENRAWARVLDAREKLLHYVEHQLQKKSEVRRRISG